MTTPADAIKSALNTNWNVGTGGTKPTLAVTEDITQKYPDAQETIVGRTWTYRHREIPVNSTFVHRFHDITFRVSTSDTTSGTQREDRLTEMVDEVKRIFRANGVTGFHVARVVTVDQSPSDKSRSVFRADLGIHLIEYLVNAATVAGSTASRDLAVGGKLTVAENVIINDAGAGPFLSVGTTADTTDPMALLRFKIEREWMFRKRSTGGGTRLALESDIDGKEFWVGYDDGTTYCAKFKVHDAQADCEVQLGHNVTVDNDLTVGRDIISAAAINIKPSGDVDDYLEFATTSDVPGIKAIGGNKIRIESDNAVYVILQIYDDGSNAVQLRWNKSTDVAEIFSTGNINLYPNDADDYWYFTAAGNIASILPVEDKVHLIGSAVLSADNVYSDDFTNTSPFKRFESPLSELKKITHKGEKIDYKSIPAWIRTVGRDPAKQLTHKETRIGPDGEEEYDVVDKRAPKDVVLDNAWSVNRMVVLLYQALQEATARIEALESR